MTRMGGAPQCVYCRQHPVVPQWKPFCSERCKMADLGRWLSAGYRVPGPPAEDDDLDGLVPSPPPEEGGSPDES